MHYHHAVHAGRVFRSIDAVDAYCDEHGGDPSSVRFCVDAACLAPPARQDTRQDAEPTD